MFQRKIESILYTIMITWSDTAHTASKLSEYLQNPLLQHQQAADQAIIYLNTIYNLSIKFSANPTKLVFTCTSDTAFADNFPLCYSTEGYLFCFFGGSID